MEQTNGRSGNPDWYEALTGDYRAGMSHAFILHGNVEDYVEDPVVDLTVTAYLAQRLGATFTVAAYSPDRGVTFPGSESDMATERALAKASRERFLRVTGQGKTELSDMERLAMQAGGLEMGADPELPREPSKAIPLLIQFLMEADGGDPIYEERTEADGSTTRYMAGTHPADPGDGTGLRALVILERLDLIAPPADKGTMGTGDRALLAALHRVGTEAVIQGRGGLLVMQAPSVGEVHADLTTTSAGVRAIEIKPPSFEQRLAYLGRIATERDLSFANITARQVAAQTAALGFRHIEDVALRAIQQADGVLSKDLVRGRKNELLSQEYDGILEVLESDVDLAQIGGHDLAVAYLKEEVIDLLQSDDPEAVGMVASGILLAGPSGTGKTYLARAIAGALGWTIVKWRPENLKGMYVGQSEQKLAKAIAGTEAMAPCIVFLDEVDQSVRRGEGSGAGGGGEAVENNMFGRILEWLSEPDHRGRILAIAATNRPDNLDAAFLRPGRFDVKIPLLVAQTAEERSDQLTRLVRRHVADPGAAGQSGALLPYAAQTEGWTAAELENLVLLAARIRKLKGLGIFEALTAARARLKSATRDVERMTMLALSICDDNSLIPEQYRALVAEPAPATEAPTTPRSVGPRRGRNLEV